MIDVFKKHILTYIIISAPLFWGCGGRNVKTPVGMADSGATVECVSDSAVVAIDSTASKCATDSAAAECVPDTLCAVEREMASAKAKAADPLDTLDFGGLNEYQIEDVKIFIRDMQSRDKYAAAKHFFYPFRAKYPYPTINNEEELVAHYDELIDARFIKALTSNGWDNIGCHGTTCGRGNVLWGSFYEEAFKIKYLAMRSSRFAAALKRAIAEERASLHQSIRDFAEPVLSASSEGCRFRVDKMKDGSFRLSVWDLPAAIYDIPDIIVSGGTVDYEGSNVEPLWRFTKDGLEYHVFLPNDGSDGYVLSAGNARDLTRWEEGKIDR